MVLLSFWPQAMVSFSTAPALLACPGKTQLPSSVMDLQELSRNLFAHKTAMEDVKKQKRITTIALE